MKRIMAVLCLLVLLTGCSGKNDELERAMALRAKMLAQKVQFDAEITADYGDKTYTFAANCETGSDGSLSFTVTAPQTIAGICGSISADSGKLIFDGKALSFPLLADGQITPVAAVKILPFNIYFSLPFFQFRDGFFCIEKFFQLRLSSKDIGNSSTGK